MMRIIGYNYCVPIDVRCHCSNLLGRSEIDLLCLISIIQNKLKVDLKKIIRISNKDYHIEMINQSNKLVESLNKSKISIPVRNEFLNKYLTNTYKINNNVIFFDFKNKLQRKCT